MRVGFYAPEAEFNTFPEKWVERYTIEGMALRDPLMRWALLNSGHVRWSELYDQDMTGVLDAYAQAGLRFGVAFSLLGTEKQPRRSVALFARPDREIENQEISKLHEVMVSAHAGDAPKSKLTAAQSEALRLLASGLRHKEIAHQLEISESAVKARLKSATLRIGARSSLHAASIAQKSGML